MRRRLTREIDDIDSADEAIEPSTGVMKTDHNVVIRNLSSTTAVVTPSEWSATKDFSEEARMLLQFVYASNKSIVLSESSAEAIPESADRFGTKIIEFFRNIFRTKKKVRLHVPSDEPEPPATEESSDNKDMIMSADEILEFFSEAQTTNFEEVKLLLENTALLSMSDTGGIPEFMDMQPALVLGPALYLIFCKLTQSLQSHYSISFLTSSGDSTDPVMSAYTGEEIIFQALSAIASASLASPGSLSVRPASPGASPGVSTASSGVKSKAIIVGTHGDLVSEDEIKAFDTDLQRKIHATDLFRDGLIQSASKDRLVLAVNNKSGGVAEVRKIQKFLEDQMKQSFKKLTIPVSWLIFSVCLRKKAVRLTSLQSCLDLAMLLNIPPDEAKLAIWFLHHQAGLLMHFPNLPELCDSVICDLQIVYDSVTHLIFNTYKFGHVHQAASDRFQQTGEFDLQDIREAIVDTSGDYIPLKKLIELLKHLNIIAQIPYSSSSTYAARYRVVYFMPCVLPNAPSAELKVSHKSSPGQVQPFPLVIRFKCGFVPTGVFTAMVASLASQPSLKMISNGMRKNRVQFHLGKAFETVTFICKAKHYEIHISRRPTAKTLIHEVCPAVRDLIQCTLEMVASRFNCTLSYHFAFECPLPIHEGGDHFCVVESGDTCPDVMACLHSKNIIPVDMEPQHLVWFGKVSNKIF